MAKVPLNEQKRRKNRERVRKHRYDKRLKRMYDEHINKTVHTRLHYALNSKNFDNQQHATTEEFVDAIDFATDFKDSLRVWKITHRISTKALNELLLILIGAGFCFLPKDSRTLMGTPINVPIKHLSNGSKMWYFGVKNCIEKVFSEIRYNIETTLDFHFDGFPISRSSHTNFWPILCSIRGWSNFQTFLNQRFQVVFSFYSEFPKIPPMILGIWVGDSKPLVNEYILQLVAELKELPHEIFIRTHRVSLKIGLFIGDTPARSLLKG